MITPDFPIVVKAVHYLRQASKEFNYSGHIDQLQISDKGRDMPLRLTKFSQCTVACVFVLILTLGVAMAHEWMAPQKAAQTINPVAYSQESIDDGRDIYLDNCLVCHGKRAVGRPVADTGLTTRSPNLVKRLRTHTEGDFHWKISNGRGEMPAFEEELSSEEIWSVINYLKFLSDHQ